MEKSFLRPIYFVHAGMAVLCALVAWLAWTAGASTLAAIVATPGAISLASIPLQLFRDERAHARSLELADRSSAIALGVTSKMAEHAFTKYAEFAEKYVKEMQRAITQMVREGATGDHMRLSAGLFAIRQDYVLWIHPKAIETLEKFEDAIWKMSVSAMAVRDGHGTAEWQQNYEVMHREWTRLVGIRYQPAFQGEVDSNYVHENLQTLAVEVMRKTLASEDYANLRTVAVNRALGK